MNVFTEEIITPLFLILESTKGIKGHEIYHPEEDVFNHSLQSLYRAFRESNDVDLILAAMLHDVGKAENKLGHDKIGADLIKPYVSAKTHFLVEQHMRIWSLLQGEMKRFKKVQYLITHPWLPELIHLARIDKMSRVANKQMLYDREKITERLNSLVMLHFQPKEIENDITES